MSLTDEIANIIDEGVKDWPELRRLQEIVAPPFDEAGKTSLPLSDLGLFVELLARRITALNDAVLRLAQELDER